MREEKIIDYRDSHTRKGKGKEYHDSFSFYPYRKNMWEWEKQQLDKILDKKLKLDSNILDFACGTGRILKYLAGKSQNVTGVDLSDSMLEITKKNLPQIEVIKADLTRDNVLKNQNRQFDVITAFRFFLNAQNSLRIEVLNELHPLLKEDGILIFNNHGNSGNLGVFLGQFVQLKNPFVKPERRVNNYNVLSESKMKKVLKNTGFEIIKTHHRSVVPVLTEKTFFDMTRFDRLEDWFSSKQYFRLLSRNIIYVCKKR